jgi:hypothetical protein
MIKGFLNNCMCRLETELIRDISLNVIYFPLESIPTSRAEDVDTSAECGEARTRDIEHGAELREPEA